MTETEKQIKEMYGMMKVLVSDSIAIKKTIWGNGRPGMEKDVTVLKERQDNCPARKQAGRDKVTRVVAILMCSFGFVSTIISVISVIVLITSKQP